MIFYFASDIRSLYTISTFATWAMRQHIKQTIHTNYPHDAHIYTHILLQYGLYSVVCGTASLDCVIFFLCFKSILEIENKIIHLTQGIKKLFTF